MLNSIVQHSKSQAAICIRDFRSMAALIPKAIGAARLLR
jgi:hypothetical protein